MESEKKPKEEKEESELEEILEDSEEPEDKEKTEKDSETKKPKKLSIIIPESVWNKSQTRSFLNRNSSVTLDRKNPFETFPKNLELNLENFETQNTMQRQNQNSKTENPFEYLPKNSQEKQQEIYQHSENTFGIKLQKAEKISESWSKPFTQRTDFQNISSENTPQQNSNYEVYIKPQKIEDIEKENKFNFRESKMEYYSNK